MQNETFVVPAVANAIDAEIQQATDLIAEHQIKGYGLNVRLGKALNTKFDFAWYELSGTDTSDAGKSVRAEKKLFTERLKAKQHPNPSQSWLRVRDAARIEREGKPAPEQGQSGASHNRSPKLRFIEELSALYKFGQRQDDLDDDCRKALTCITSALVALRVDVGMIDAK